MTTVERMEAALQLLAKRWPRRAPKAFYLGPADWEEFMATNPPTGVFPWGNNPVKQRTDPVFQGFPVRASENVLPRRSKLYDNTGSAHPLPESELPPRKPKVAL